MALRLPVINECEATDCVYNDNRNCHAQAITVGDRTHPMCDTYLRADEKGGIQGITGGVGACKVDSCIYNRSFECVAPQGINVGRNGSDVVCTTFAPV